MADPTITITHKIELSQATLDALTSLATKVIENLIGTLGLPEPALQKAPYTAHPGEKRTVARARELRKRYAENMALPLICNRLNTLPGEILTTVDIEMWILDVQMTRGQAPALLPPAPPPIFQSPRKPLKKPGFSLVQDVKIAPRDGRGAINVTPDPKAPTVFPENTECVVWEDAEAWAQRNKVSIIPGTSQHVAKKIINKARITMGLTPWTIVASQNRVLDKLPDPHVGG